MNENLTERFVRSRDAFKGHDRHVAPRPPPPQLNEKIRQYFEPTATPPEVGSWMLHPEIPCTNEIVDLHENGFSGATVPEIRCNLPKGEWESKETYLRTHYELLREDALGPLREVIKRVREHPRGNEDEFENIAVGIYEKVRICGVTCSTRGIAIRVTFSVYRTGKKILWEQSKRLITGGLVVLTPKSDMFTTKAVVATVAARPLAALQQNPPEIDLFIARADEQEIDPAIEWVMVEERGGLYEAHRHTLLALQKMMREPFPLLEHLVNAEPSVDVSRHVQNRRVFDLSDVIPNTRDQSYDNVNILDNWPEDPECKLDQTQLAALRRMLTKRLAVIQGPPGTGKTHVSVQAVKIMLANRKMDDPPIIIACQTNHAIDQLLRHIADFEPEGFVRLGGRSKDQDKVKARTLFQVRQLTSDNPVSGSLGKTAKNVMKKIDAKFEILLTSLAPNKQPLNLETLVNLKLLTQRQAESLVAGASEWIQDHKKNTNSPWSPFPVWLGKALVPVPYKPMEEDYGFDFEEADLEFEQLKELEAENVARDDEDFETLRGTTFPVADNFTASSKSSGFISTAKVKDVLNEQNMWKIPAGTRPAVYRYLQAELKKHILSDLRNMTRSYNEQALRRRIGIWEHDETILSKQKIIGMTTTGLSKYRALIAALEPKVVLIEEAAETLEAPVTVACLPTLQQLILVGDHQQLRPHCHSRNLEDTPYYLNISLFERLVNNGVEFTRLSTQRRMVPEIRRLLRPIYGKSIKDHETVLDPRNRPHVPGMGGVNSFFFTHRWLEQRDDQMSAFNSKEADMVANFVEYLAYNNVRLENITVLTFYNGQRKTILGRLRQIPSLNNQTFKVVTVDSYQGEENEVIILSLVRSNDRGMIGFLNNINRVCVALSRARCGFYMFGNADLLYDYRESNRTYNKNEVKGKGQDKTFWQKIISILDNQGGSKSDRLTVEPKSRISGNFVVRCSNHNNKTVITDPTDFNKIVGGCAVEKCDDMLPCGHPCQLLCHAFPHGIVHCHLPCMKALPCNHPCDSICKEACHCPTCHRTYAKEDTAVQEQGPAKENTPHQTAAESWKSFANAEHVRHTATASRKPSHCHQEGNANALLDVSVEGVTTNMENTALRRSGAASSSQKDPSPTLMKEQVAKTQTGKRVKRKEMFTSSASEQSTMVKEDWSKKDSLLDM